MEKGLVVKKEIFIQKSKQNIRDHYTIEPKEIGKGSFGKVYLGRPKEKPQSLRAIKMIAKQYSNSYHMNQALLLRQLDHPNVLKLYATYEDKDAFYLVTDYLEGGDLLTKLEAGPISEQQAKEIFKQALEAVSYCHSQGIMHRDVKLENLVFLGPKTVSLKLIDFGLGLKWTGRLLQKELLKRGQTKQVGSVLYMSPECLRGAYNHKCDIWSLAVVLYAMVSAQFPFEGSNDQQIQNKIRTNKLTIPIQKLQVSQHLQDLLAKMFLPEDRRPGAAELFEHPWLKENQSKAPLKLNFGKLANFSKFSKMKTLAVSFIASQLSEKQIQKLSALFRQLDLNHDGFLSVDEIKRAFEQQKQKSSLTDLAKLISFIDTDKNGKINYTEFVSCCLQNSVVFKEENLKAAFKLLDRDENGKIEKGELAQLLKQSGRDFNPKVVEEIMAACDKNGDGSIDYQEFVDNLTKR